MTLGKAGQEVSAIREAFAGDARRWRRAALLGMAAEVCSAVAAGYLGAQGSAVLH